MDYRKIYNQIINRALTRKHINGYAEKHHIIPKSLGGTDDLDNIVTLTAREHFIAHACLYKSTTGIDKFKMACAWNYMCSSTSKHTRYINSRMFVYSKRAYLNEKRKKTLDGDANIIKLYNSGMTMFEVSETLGKTVKTIHTALHRNNVEVRKAVRKEKVVVYDVLYDLYVTHWLTLNDVATSLSISVPTVKQQLTKNNIRIRTNCEQRNGLTYYVTPKGTFPNIKLAAEHNSTSRYCIKTYCHNQQHGYYLVKGGSHVRNL